MKDEKIKLIHGDSYKEIKKIADNSIDLILTDPPYNLGMYSTGNIKMSWRKDFKTKELKFNKDQNLINRFLNKYIFPILKKSIYSQQFKMIRKDVSLTP